MEHAAGTCRRIVGGPAERFLWNMHRIPVFLAALLAVTFVWETDRGRRPALCQARGVI